MLGDVSPAGGGGGSKEPILPGAEKDHRIQSGDETYSVSDSQLHSMNVNEGRVDSATEGRLLEEGSSDAAAGPPPLAGRVEKLDIGKAKLTEVPLSEQEKHIFTYLSTYPDMSDMTQKCGLFNRLMQAITTYDVAYVVAKKAQTTWQWLGSAMSSVVYTPNHHKIIKERDGLKESFVKEAWPKLGQLFGSVVNISSPETREEIKKEILAIVGSLDGIGEIEENPQAAMIIGGIEEEFGLVGLTKSGKELVASVRDMDDRVARANNLIEFVLSRPKVTNHLKKEFFRLPGDSALISRALAAYERRGLEALQKELDSEKFKAKDLAGVLKKILRNSFQSVKTLDVESFPGLFAAIVNIVAHEDRDTVNMSSVYQGFPQGKAECRLIEAEIGIVRATLEDSGNSQYVEIKEELGSITEVDLLKLIFYPDELRVGEELQGAIDTILSEHDLQKLVLLRTFV